MAKQCKEGKLTNIAGENFQLASFSQSISKHKRLAQLKRKSDAGCFSKSATL